MTRKDYERIAEQMNRAYKLLNTVDGNERDESKAIYRDTGFSYAMAGIIRAMQNENTRFDADKFCNAVYERGGINTAMALEASKEMKGD